MNQLIARTRRPDITFFSTGRIEISRRATMALGLAEGDIINIAPFPEGHYLYIGCTARVAQGRHRATCRSACPGSRHMHAFSASLARTMRHAAGIGADIDKFGFILGTPVLHPDFGVMLPIAMGRPLLLAHTSIQ